MKTENPVCWFEIYKNDIQRATRFYQTVLETMLSPLSVPQTTELGTMNMAAFSNKNGITRQGCWRFSAKTALLKKLELRLQVE